MTKHFLKFLFLFFSFFLGIITLFTASTNGINGFSTMDQHIVRLPTLFTHIFSASLALLLLALQFLIGLKQRSRKIHRTIGYAYVFFVMSSSISAALLSPYSDTGLIASIGFFSLSTISIFTTIMALTMAKSKNYLLHRKWMIRSGSLIFAGVMLRIYLGFSDFIGIRYEIAYPIVAWISWLPNLLAVEYFLSIKSIKRDTSPIFLSN